MEKSILLSRISDKTEELFEALFQSHWNRLHRLLSRMTSDPDEAEDLCMQAYLQLHQQMTSIKSKENLAGWLYRTATNLGLNFLRAQRRRNQYETLAYDFVTPIPENPAEKAEIRQERKMVRQILSELKPREAQILLLRSSGLSYAELAVACNLAPSSVGTILARAEREFEKRFKARFGEKE